jgi:hypothetical protein
MTKEEARIKLTEYLNKTQTIWNESIQLPITDAVVYSVVATVPSKDKIEYGDTTIEQYTFKGLLKIAYDLHD